MSKKLILVLMLVVFFSSCRLAFASLSVNEIMYDLQGADSTGGKSREWIEIYNPDLSAVSIDASKWRVYDGSGNRTINSEVNFSIPAGAFVVFAGNKDTFLIDHPGFSGTVYDTGITSLNNTGATLKLLDQDGNIVDSVTYNSSQGAAGDGNSLQKISGVWTVATPTPGAVNQGQSASLSAGPVGFNSLVSNNETTNSFTPASVQTKNKTNEEPKIKVQISTKALGFAGLPLSLEGIALGTQGERLHYGKYFWNFGDGDSKEIMAVDNVGFSHTYFYPGEYNVVLDYYSNPYLETPDASAQIAIKIIGTDIIISKVGDENDFFVEIKNNTDYNADISNWILASDGKNFVFPRHTVLPPEKTITVSPKISGFSVVDKDSLKLINPQGETVFDYVSSLASILPKIKSEKSTTSENDVLSENFPKEKISADSLTATPILSLDESKTYSQNDVQNSKNSHEIIFFTTFFIFIGISAGAAYFIRHRGRFSGTVNEFEIMDE